MLVLFFSAVGAAVPIISCPVVTGITCLNVSFSYSGTGPLAAESAALANGYTFWVETVNNGPGIRNIISETVYKINLFAADDGSQAQNCAANYQTFINNNDDFLLGPFGSDLSTVAMGVAAEAPGGPAILVQSTTASPLSYNATAITFGSGTLGIYYTGTSIQLLAQTGVKSVYTVTRTDSHISTEIAVGAQQYIATAGFNVVGSSTYTSSSLSGSSAGMMAAVKQANPDALFIFGHHPEVEVFMRNLQQINFTPKALLAPLAPNAPGFISDMGSMANGVLGSSQWVSTLPSLFFNDTTFGTAAQYAANYQNRFGVPANDIAASASAAGLILQIGIAGAAGLTPRHMQAAIRGTTTQSFYGTLRFNTSGENIGKVVLGVQVQNGDVVLVAPQQYAVAKLQYPMPPFPAGPANPPKHGHKLSAGSVLVIIFFVLLFVYCVAGVIYKGTQGARGLEMVPNIKLWRRVPGLIAEGCMFTFSTVTCRARKASNYETISS